MAGVSCFGGRENLPRQRARRCKVGLHRLIYILVLSLHQASTGLWSTMKTISVLLLAAILGCVVLGTEAKDKKKAAITHKVHAVACSPLGCLRQCCFPPTLLQLSLRRCTLMSRSMASPKVLS